MEHIYKFVKDPTYVGTKNNTFTHYWNNSSINFPDVSAFDSDSSSCYLKKYYPNYHWELCDELGINKTNIANATLTISSWTEPVIFIKFYDDEAKEIPSYYYAINPNSQTIISSQSVHTVYQLELDLWATIGWRFNNWLKSFKPDVMFLRKMCDRFVFNKDSDTGYWIDFKKQPYLTRSPYSFELIKDETEKSLTMEEWLWINSGKSSILSLSYWLEHNWFPWLENQWSAEFDPSTEQPAEPQVSAEVSLIPGIYQNIKIRSENNIFNDSSYNSNGKYKWLAIKTGNNTSEYDVEGKAKTLKGSVFRPNGTILIEKGPLEDPYLTIDAEIKSGVFNDEGGKYIIKYQKEITYPEDFPTTGAIISFTDELLKNKFIKINITKTNILEPSETLSQDVFISDHLDKVLKQIDISSLSKNVEYDLVNFNERRVVFPNSDVYVDITPRIYLILLENSYEVNLEIELEDTFDNSEFTISLVNDMLFNTINLYDETKQSPYGKAEDIERFTFNGEEIMYIPVKKGLEGQQYIKWLNNTSSLVFANQNVMGMPINDIPPSVLAMAIRNQADKSEMQNYGDIVSTRNAVGKPNCPLDIVQMQLVGQKYIPVLFNSLNYIPITIANSPRMNRMYEVIGGTNFFNKFYNIMSSEELTRENTIDSEPIFLAPQFFQWVYFIDGGNKLILTPDMIDWHKVVTKSDWTVKLNVNMTDTTHLKLDISDIKYDLYPFSRSQSELISIDPIQHPYSCEAFNNYQANNAYTKETSKNAKDIQNWWAKANVPVYQAGSFFSNLGQGIAGGAAAGGIVGAMAGGVGGLVSGIAELVATGFGTENKIKMVDQLWDNQWNGMFSNMYSSPALLNPSGFGSGSLIYSDIATEKTEQMELFRTFSLIDIYKKTIWDDISVNGYPFCSQCQYKEYENRLNYNMVQCNFDDRDAEVNKYLREKVSGISTLFAQQSFVDWYKVLCKAGFRLWKVDFSEKDTEELIKGNIEIGYKPPYKPTAQYVKYVQKPLPLDIVVNDKYGDDYWNDRSNYNWEVLNGTYRFKKTKPYSVKMSIPYSKLFNKSVTTPEQFISHFETIATQYDTSNIELKTKVGVLASDVNQALYTLTNIFFNSGETHYEKDVINQAFNRYPFANILKVVSGDKVINSKNHTSGWNITLDLVEKFVNVTLTEINYYDFNANEDITSWMVKKQTSSETIELECPELKVEPYEGNRRFAQKSGSMVAFCGTAMINSAKWNLPEERRGQIYYIIPNNKISECWANDSTIKDKNTYVLMSGIEESFLKDQNKIEIEAYIPVNYTITDWNGIDASTIKGLETCYSKVKEFSYVISYDCKFSLEDGKIVCEGENKKIGFAVNSSGENYYRLIYSEFDSNIYFGCNNEINVVKNSSGTYDLVLSCATSCFNQPNGDGGALMPGEPYDDETKKLRLKSVFSFDRTAGSKLDATFNIGQQDLALEEHNKLNSLIFVKREE